MGKCHFALFYLFSRANFYGSLVDSRLGNSIRPAKYSAAMTLSRGFRGRSSRKWESFFTEIRWKKFLPTRCCAFLSQVLTISFFKFGALNLPCGLLYIRHLLRFHVDLYSSDLRRPSVHKVEFSKPLISVKNDASATWNAKNTHSDKKFCSSRTYYNLILDFLENEAFCRRTVFHDDFQNCCNTFWNWIIF